MDKLKRILLGLTICVGILPPSISSAQGAADLKHEIALLKNQMQSLEMRIASADQTDTKTDISANNSATSTTSQNNKLTKKAKHEHGNNPQSTAVDNKSSNNAPQEIISPAVSTPLTWQAPDNRL